ncbi:MAG: trypsin-like peptidase domain-containing protein [Burkholderiales bacterium]|nr:trypsin-like peptidase domain-containing protein [Burkholderiales bacterium]
MKDVEVTPPMPVVSSPIDLHGVFLKVDADYFSRHVFGVPYSSLKAVLYPTPRYRAFIIAKRNGSPRIIHEPKRQLKEFQLKLLSFMESQVTQIKPCVHGFVKGRSIVSNAERHLETQPHHLLNLDLEDFFPSISFYRVRGVFKKAPFGLSHEVATVLAQLCTYSNSLPQGAPTSPMLSNLVCRSLDRDLTALARRHRATYTRYADDLTFSFTVRDPNRLPSNICSFDSGIVNLGHELQALIQEQHHFRINPKKTRMSTRFHRMEVTGLTINEFANVKREFIDRIRGALSAWKKYGYGKSQASWQDRVIDGQTKPYEQRLWRRQVRGGGVPELKNVLWGKLLYVRMVRGRDDSIYTRLADLYNELCKQEKKVDKDFLFSSLPVEKIVRNAVDAERAVFVIEWSGDYCPPGASASEMVGGQGTAFAYKKADQLITCDHVFNWEGQYAGASVSVNCQSSDVHGLTLRAVNPATGLSWPVTIVRRDAPRDLAVLQIAGGSLAHRHFVAIEAPLKRNTRGFLIGYPNWSPGRVANQVTANVQSLYNRSALARFEISTLIRQGNSGGPFVDAQFRLVGVAQQGATQQSGNDECLSVLELEKWL